MIMTYGNGVGSRLNTAASSMAVRRDEPKRRGFHVGQLVDGLRERDLVEDFERSGMNGVAAKVAVEVAMRLEQCHADARPRQEQRQRDARGTRTDDAAGRVDAARPSWAVSAEWRGALIRPLPEERSCYVAGFHNKNESEPMNVVRCCQ